MLDLKSVYLFARVATLLQMARAGQEFGLSPTSTTLRIQALERQLGVRLLNRSTRSISLTPDGQRFLQHAEQIIANVEEAKNSLSGKNAATGYLRVTASATFGRRYIVPHISEFLALHPVLKMELQLTDNIVDIVEKGFDLAIRVGALADSNLVARKLLPNKRLLVAAPEYLVKNGTPASVADLENHNCLSDGHVSNWRFVDKSGREHGARIDGRFRTNHGEALALAAIAGEGIALKSVWDIADHIKAGDLKPVLSAFTPLPEWNIWAVQTSSKLTPPRITAFLDFLSEKLRRASANWESISDN